MSIAISASSTTSKNITTTPPTNTPPTENREPTTENQIPPPSPAAKKAKSLRPLFDNLADAGHHLDDILKDLDLSKEETESLLASRQFHTHRQLRTQLLAQQLQLAAQDHAQFALHRLLDLSTSPHPAVARLAATQILAYAGLTPPAPSSPSAFNIPHSAFMVSPAPSPPIESVGFRSPAPPIPAAPIQTRNSKLETQKSPFPIPFLLALLFLLLASAACGLTVFRRGLYDGDFRHATRGIMAMAANSGTDIDAQVEMLIKGTEHVYSPAELKKRLELAAKAGGGKGRQLRVKLGMDPTAPDLHLGHAVVLRKMRQFQDLGHRAVLIIGDATAMIGDPTGKKKTRPVLTAGEVQKNAATYFAQAGKILDMSEGKVEVRYNSEWLHKMTFADALKLCQKMTVARMLERDTFHERYKAGEAIYIHEFMYPLMQGWDSVMVKADVELGGTDQTFNNLVGRDLQESESQPPQIVMIMPILVGTDGVQKMSKSLNNYIGVAEPAGEQFGKAMSIPDEIMPGWFRMATPLPEERIASLLNPVDTHPRLAKEVLGKSIVEQYHSAEAAAQAAEDFRKRFTEGEVLSDVEVKRIAAALFKDGKIGVLSLIKETGFAPSTSEARRLVEGGAVTFAGAKVTDMKATLQVNGGEVLKVGKLRICKIEVE